MRISDWSSDVCSSDLLTITPLATPGPQRDVATAPATAPVAASTARGEQRGDGGSIRVATAKIDALINLVGELVITQAMLQELASHQIGRASCRERVCQYV